MKIPAEELLLSLKNSDKKCYFSMLVRIEKRYDVKIALENSNMIVKMCKLYDELVQKQGKSWDYFEKEFLKNE